MNLTLPDTEDGRHCRPSSAEPLEDVYLQGLGVPHLPPMLTETLTQTVALIRVIASRAGSSTISSSKSSTRTISSFSVIVIFLFFSRSSEVNWCQQLRNRILHTCSLLVRASLTASI